MSEVIADSLGDLCMKLYTQDSIDFNANLMNMMLLDGMNEPLVDERPEWEQAEEVRRREIEMEWVQGMTRDFIDKIYAVKPDAVDDDMENLAEQIYDAVELWIPRKY